MPLVDEGVSLVEFEVVVPVADVESVAGATAFVVFSTTVAGSVVAGSTGSVVTGSTGSVVVGSTGSVVVGSTGSVVVGSATVVGSAVVGAT